MKSRHVFYARHTHGIKLTTSQAYTTPCPKCGAKPGAPCLYWPQDDVVNRVSASPIILAKRARVGTPTKRPHNERYYSEQLRLGLWLLEHGHILWTHEKGTQ